MNAQGLWEEPSEKMNHIEKEAFILESFSLMFFDPLESGSVQINTGRHLGLY